MPEAPPVKKKKKRRETFVICGAKIQALRDALERRGWVEEEDADSTSFGLKWTIKAAKAEQHITDGTVGDEQILNHFERAWELITKHRLSGNLRALPWTEGVDPDTFVPRTYYVHEPAQLKEFVVDYFVTAARAALVDAVASSAWPPAAPERVNAAVSIIRRFLARIQEAAAHARLEEASADHARAAEELRRIPLNGSSSAAAAEPAAAASQTTRAAASTGVAKAVVKKGAATVDKDKEATVLAPTAVAMGGGSAPTRSRALLAAAVDLACKRVEAAGSHQGAPSTSSSSSSRNSGAAWLHRCSALRGADPTIEAPDWHYFLGSLDATAEGRLKRALGVSIGSPAAAALSAAAAPPPPPPQPPPQPPPPQPPPPESSGGSISSSSAGAASCAGSSLGSSTSSTSTSSSCRGSGAAAALALRTSRAVMGAGDTLPASWTARLPTSAVLARAVVEAVLSELQAAFGGGVSSAARCLDREGGSTAVVVGGGEATGDGDDGNDNAAELGDRIAATATPRTSAASPPAIGGAIGSAWILKAMNMSRGRGITIESAFGAILEGVQHASAHHGAHPHFPTGELGAILERLFEREHKMIAQRYVDRPLLIERRKFDMRQWVLVTSINPLVVWRYSHYYLRFSSREYNDDLADRVTHLTNQSIQKKCEGYGTAIEGNMWSREQFHSFLTAEHGAEAGARTAAAVEARMSAVVGDTMRAVCDVIEPRAASFELYGFDLMLDAQYGVWLLEVNSSPDMSRNAAPLRAIVDQGLDDLLNVVLELQHKRTSVKQLAAERETREAPCWRLAYKGRALEERELLRRRFRKKCGADSLAVALAATSAAGSAAAIPVEGGSSSSGTKRESKPVGLWK